MSTLNVTNISDGTNSTSTTNVVKGSAKAWVNFNGTGTVAIREAYNVSSITDDGTGQYTGNFTIAMPDANFAVLGGGQDTAANRGNRTIMCRPKSTTEAEISSVVATSNSGDDMEFYSMAVFR